MKSILAMLSMCILLGCAQQEDGAKVSVDFREVSYSQALDLAKAEGRKLFLYFHFEGCGACKELENTAFVDAVIAKHINANFVCLNVNTSYDKGREINKDFNVHTAPTCMIVNAEGDAVGTIVGYIPKDEFLRRLKNLGEESSELLSARRRYKAGDRDERFVRGYIHLLRTAELPFVDVLEEYIDRQPLSALTSEANFELLYDIIPESASSTTSFRGKGYAAFLSAIKKHGDKYPREQLDGRILAGIYPYMRYAIEKSNARLFDSLMVIADAVQSTDMILLEDRNGRPMIPISPQEFGVKARMKFHRKSGNTEKYHAALEEHLAAIWDDAMELNNLAWSFNNSETSRDTLHLASKWVQRSIALESVYENNDTYAALLYRLGEHKKALAQAEKALAIAKRTSATPTETHELIAKIKKAMK